MQRKGKEVTDFLKMLNQLHDVVIKKKVKSSVRTQIERLDTQEASLTKNRQDLENEIRNITSSYELSSSKITNKIVHLELQLAQFKEELELLPSNEAKSETLDTHDADASQNNSYKHKQHSIAELEKFIVNLTKEIAEENIKLNALKQPYGERLLELKNAQQDITDQIGKITIAKVDLGQTVTSKDELKRKATEALSKVPKEAAPLSSSDADHILDLFENEITLAAKWVNSPYIIDNLGQSSRFNRFYENVLKGMDITAIDDLSGIYHERLEAISKMTPVYISNNPALNQGQRQSNQEEIQFQRDLRNLNGALQEINKYVGTKTTRNANFRPGSLATARAEELRSVTEDFMKVDGINYQDKVDQYHRARGKLILLQAKIKEFREEMRQIPLREVLTGTPDSGFPKYEQAIADLAKLQAEETKLQQVVAKHRTDLQDYVRNMAPKVEKAYQEAVTAAEHKTMRTHKFFTSKPLSDTTPITLLKKLVSSFREAATRIKAPAQIGPKQEAEPQREVSRKSM